MTTDNQNQTPSDNSDQKADWRTTLITDEALRNDPSMKDVPDVNTLAKNYINAKAVIGRKGLVLPKDENDVDGWNNVYKTLGRPESKDKYNLEKVTVPDDMKQYIDQKKFESIKDIAYKHGLTQKQFEGVVKEWTDQSVGDIKNILESKAKAKAEAENSLLQEWGAANAAKREEAKKAMLEAGFTEDEMKEVMENPRMIKAFANIGSKISGDRLEKGGVLRQPTPDEARKEMREIQAHEAYNKQNHPDHEEYVKRWVELHKLANTKG